MLYIDTKHAYYTNNDYPTGYSREYIDVIKKFIKSGDKIEYDLYDINNKTMARCIGYIKNIDGDYIDVGYDKYRIDKVFPRPSYCDIETHKEIWSAQHKCYGMDIF